VPDKKSRNKVEPSDFVRALTWAKAVSAAIPTAVTLSLISPLQERPAQCQQSPEPSRQMLAHYACRWSDRTTTALPFAGRLFPGRFAARAALRY
jgi:hypothetical protein